MTFSVDDFIVKVALQVDDSQLKQAKKDLTGLGLGSVNQASERVSEKPSEFIGPPQRARQHAYDSRVEREGQGKDNLRNRRIRAQTSLDFLRWPAVISAGMGIVVSPLVKLYNITEKWQASLLNALSKLDVKSVSANLSKRDVRVVENINEQTPLKEGALLGLFTRIAQIKAEKQYRATVRSISKTIGEGELQGFYINPTLQAEGPVAVLTAVRNAIKNLSGLDVTNYGTQYGLGIDALSYLKNVTDAQFASDLAQGSKNTIEQKYVDLTEQKLQTGRTSLASEKAGERRSTARNIQREIDKDLRDISRLAGARNTTLGTMTSYLKLIASSTDSFTSRFGEWVDELVTGNNYEDRKNQREAERAEEEREEREKKQPLSLQLNVNGQLQNGTLNFTEELTPTNGQTFMADINRTA